MNYAILLKNQEIHNVKTLLHNNIAIMSGYVNWQKSLSETRKTHRKSQSQSQYVCDRAQLLAIERSNTDAHRKHNEITERKAKFTANRSATEKKLRSLKEDAEDILLNNFMTATNEKIKSLKFPSIWERNRPEYLPAQRISSKRATEKEIAKIREKQRQQQRIVMRLQNYHKNLKYGMRVYDRCYLLYETT